MNWSNGPLAGVQLLKKLTRQHFVAFLQGCVRFMNEVEQNVMVEEWNGSIPTFNWDRKIKWSGSIMRSVGGIEEQNT
jgi:hypothetical protein